VNKQETKKLEQKICSKIEKQNPEKKPLILGLSGGADSVFLFYMLIISDQHFICAHLNHNLRGDESTDDQDFCTKLCKSHKIKFELLSEDIKKIARKKKIGLEEAGRIERYKFFGTLQKKYKAKYILTAHHADDNAETIIKNLSRGASLSGLSGIKEVQTDIFRPILDVSKNEITEYLKAKKIDFRTDKSNLDTRYQRNFIRHEIMPLMETLNPSFSSTLAKNTKNLKEIESFLIEEAQKYLKENLKSKNKGTDTLNKKSFKSLHVALKKEIIKSLLGQTDTENVYIEEILTLIEKNIGNKSKTQNGKKFTLKNGEIVITKIKKTK
jgi:tRNA(Ile)-lysidine synthase